MDTWNYELNCKWSFPDMPDNGSIVGPNEPMTENFKKHHTHLLLEKQYRILLMKGWTKPSLLK